MRLSDIVSKLLGDDETPEERADRKLGELARTDPLLREVRLLGPSSGLYAEISHSGRPRYRLRPHGAAGSWITPAQARYALGLLRTGKPAWYVLQEIDKQWGAQRSGEPDAGP